MSLCLLYRVQLLRCHHVVSGSWNYGSLTANEAIEGLALKKGKGAVMISLSSCE